ncbi:MipA/OmpV family protein [Pseudoalteromonas 'SMAR']|uniref:MipA/OmpV family protein n=1 Tax=Pseudoalteromonas 'SMAR' TaxID=3416908 RepID=UPI003AF276A5
MKKFLGALALLLALPSLANSSDCDAEQQQCVAVGQWQVGVAVGAGVISNPLHQGENIPLVVVPYLSYYGEQLFFDNGTLGYTLVNKPRFDFSLITTFNAEQAYFEKFHPNNIFLQKTFLDSSAQLPGGESTVMANAISLQQIAKRKWAADGGVLMHWLLNNQVKVSASWLSDITNTYQGYLAEVALSYRFALSGKASAALKAGVQWKSQALIDYYYGIDGKDTANASFWYDGKASLQPYLSFAYSYALSEQWQFKFNAKYKRLDSAMTNSPLVTDDYTATVFVGGKYEF